MHLFVCYTTESFSIRQNRRNVQDENKDSRISYNNSTMFNSNDYLVQHHHKLYYSII